MPEYIHEYRRGKLTQFASKAEAESSAFQVDLDRQEFKGQRPENRKGCEWRAASSQEVFMTRRVRFRVGGLSEDVADVTVGTHRKVKKHHGRNVGESEGLLRPAFELGPRTRPLVFWLFFTMHGTWSDALPQCSAVGPRFKAWSSPWSCARGRQQKNCFSVGTHAELRVTFTASTPSEHAV